MSQLAQILSAYAVPLQIWLTPEARKNAAPILLSHMDGRAEIHINPLSAMDELAGPAVLIITAHEITAQNNETLKALARTAHPGRAILLGGTSDRDTLMKAINEWGVIRVLPSEPSPDTLVTAIDDAEAYLKREVALSTAIDDLDIENTMLESAIDHLEGGIERTRVKSRSSATTTFAAGLSALLRREQDSLSRACENLEEPMVDTMEHAIAGLNALAALLDKTHDRAVEAAADLPPIPEALDSLIATVRDIITQQGGEHIGGHLGSGAQVQIEPLALVQILIQIADRGPGEPAREIESYRSGDHAIVEFRFNSPIDGAIIDAHMSTRAWSMLSTASATLNSVDADPHILRLSLLAAEDVHG